MEGRKEFVQIDGNDLYPYLLVNIGSGVSMIKVVNCIVQTSKLLNWYFFMLFFCFAKWNQLDMIFILIYEKKP